MGWREVVATLLSGRMWVALLMGFACGVPLLLTGSVLQAWLTDEGVDLALIGLYALVGLPYTLKFLWAPLLDRYTLPLLGRRRGWLLLFQLLLVVAVAALGQSEPAAHPLWVAVAAFLVTLFSASQDIVVDAYRRERLSDEELGLGASLYVNGYRIGMLLAGSGGLILADQMPFSQVYLLMAAALLVGVVTTLLAAEPTAATGQPTTLKQAVIAPLLEYFQRPQALLLLAFILFYKVGDTMAAAITTPFYLELGFSRTEIGSVVKLFGFWATIGGGVLGGLLLLRIGIDRGLWLFGGLQALSTAGFALLAWYGVADPALLALVVAFENLSGGMGTAAYVALMGRLTDRRFTATQYALLTSLMGIPRVILAAPTGWLAEQLGWIGFFSFCTAVALPGLLLLARFAPWPGWRLLMAARASS